MLPSDVIIGIYWGTSCLLIITIAVSFRFILKLFGAEHWLRFCTKIRLRGRQVGAAISGLVCVGRRPWGIFSDGRQVCMRKSFGPVDILEDHVSEKH